MTTNGITLGKKLPELAEAGLDALNISLDTLNPKKFSFITRLVNLIQILESISSTFKQF